MQSYPSILFSRQGRKDRKESSAEGGSTDLLASLLLVGPKSRCEHSVISERSVA